MKHIYFTITGLKHHVGNGFFEKGLEVTLIKDINNEYDNEAIKVNLEGIGTIGYVANTPYTKTDESYSAGRLYDKIDDTASGTMMYLLGNAIVCKLNQ